MASKKYLVGLNLTQNELQNAVIQNLGTAPTSPAPIAGQIYFNTASNTLFFYNGTSWVDFVQQTQINYGLFSNRPAAAPSNNGSLYFATDQGLLYISDGSIWSQISQFGTTTAQTTYGLTSASGSSNQYARTDHTHGTPSLSDTTPQALAIGGTGAAGSGTTPSRNDHTHAMPAFGSVTAQTAFGAASSNGSATSVTRSDHTHGTPTHDNAAHSAINLSALAAPTADISLANYKITSLATPVSPADAATKQYVDDVAQGLHIHAASWAGTTTALNATYDNGTSGVGATLTNAGTQAAFQTDGITPSLNDRILVKNQTNTAENGIYTLTALGDVSTNWVLTRAADFNTAAEIAGGDFTFVDNGTTLANTGWVQIDDVTTVGTTPIIWQQFSGAGTYVAGNGILLTGNVFSAVAGSGITVTSGGINIDTSVVVRKYAANVGDGTNTSYTITHSLNTKDVTVALYDNSAPFAEVTADIQHTSTSAITVIFSVAPTSNQYRVVVQG